MHEKFSHRIELALERLAARIARSTQHLEATQVNRQIGRILQQNQRAAARFVVSLKDSRSPAGFYLHVKHSAEFDQWAELSEGAYLLRSNITDWSDEQLWKAYIQLTQAEAAFRIQKDQLRVRPIWHQRAGLGNSPRTVLEEIARIQSHDVILPTTTHGEIRLRCVTQPDAAQAALLDRLGIVLPKRMRLSQLDLPAIALSA